MLLLLFARHEAWVYAAPHNTFMPSLAKGMSERVTVSELGVGDRIFGQIPFDGGSTGDKGQQRPDEIMA